jgi:hypothetical protein
MNIHALNFYLLVDHVSDFIYIFEKQQLSNKIRKLLIENE